MDIEFLEKPSRDESTPTGYLFLFVSEDSFHGVDIVTWIKEYEKGQREVYTYI